MQVTGTFHFYARAIYSTMLSVLRAITSEQNTPTENTMKWVKKFLDYAAYQEEKIITLNASDMVQEICSDASYLSKINTCSCVGGQYFLSSDEENLPNNGAVLNL